MARSRGLAAAGLTAVALAVATCCNTAQAPRAPSTAPPRKAVATPHALPAPSAITRAGPVADAAPESAPPAPAPLPLPEGIVPGAFVRLEVPRDRSAWVIHGDPGVTRVLVYLHGVCGNIRAVAPFGKMLARYGTLIALKGDQRCQTRGRYRWSSFIPGIHDRFNRAIDVIRTARGGVLDSEQRIAIGYSQGATRAAALTERYPTTYPLLLLAGAPTKPRVSRSGAARAIAVLGGEWEPNQHMQAGVEDLALAGRRAAYFELPQAAHGEYGPDGKRVLEAALRFLLEHDAASAPSPAR